MVTTLSHISQGPRGNARPEPQTTPDAFRRVYIVEGIVFFSREEALEFKTGHKKEVAYERNLG